MFRKTCPNLGSGVCEKRYHFLTRARTVFPAPLPSMLRLSFGPSVRLLQKGYVFLLSSIVPSKHASTLDSGGGGGRLCQAMSCRWYLFLQKPEPDFGVGFHRTTSIERDHRGPLPLVPSSLQTQIHKGILAAWDTELGLVEAILGAPSWDYFK